MIIMNDDLCFHAADCTLLVENMETDGVNQVPMLRGLSEDEVPVLIR